MSIVTPADFSQKNARYYIPKTNGQEEELQSYIDQVECDYLPLLLGVELYELFIADLDTNNEPQAQIYKDIFEPFKRQYENHCIDQSSRVLVSDGMKAIIMGLTYFIYLRDRITRVTTVGLKQTEGVNSSNVGGVRHDLNSRYNQAVGSFLVIQEFITKINNCVDYPTFKGQAIEYNHAL